MIRERIVRLARAAAVLPVWAAVRGRARGVAATRSWTPAEEARARLGFWPKLRRNAGRLPFVEDLVAAWYAMMDPLTPHAPRAVLIAALAYFVMPMDLIPDFIAGTGFLDDATVLGFALSAVQRHILPRHRARAREALVLEPLLEKS